MHPSVPRNVNIRRTGKGGAGQWGDRSIRTANFIAYLLATTIFAGVAGTVEAGETGSDLRETAGPLAVTRHMAPTAPILIGDIANEPAIRPNDVTVVASLSPDAEIAALELRDGPQLAYASAPGDSRDEAAATPADELKESEILFEADSVSRESDDSPIIAEGNVSAYVDDQHILADRLSYDPATDIVVAEGNVSISGDGVEAVFADRVELTGDLRDGISENFSAVLEENARLAGDTAVREQGARTSLNRAVYSACNLCNKAGEAKTPTWRVRALRITRDEERKVVRFRHAFFEIKGVPIFYAPFLQAPDPSVERQSGFLTPVIGASSRLGFNLELPYYLALSDHQDATFIPKYTSNDGVLWQGEYRRRDRSGYHVWQAGVINFGETGVEEDPAADVPNLRWHFFGRGHRDVGEKWTAGYDIERVSDDTYLRRYGVERRGDLRQEIVTSSSNRLRSNIYGRWTSGGSKLSLNAYAFQGLRAQDDAALTPYVLPLLNFRHDFADEIAGGRAHVNANFASLLRTGGADMQRFTASAFWEGEHITQGGHRFNFFGELRADAYYLSDLDQGTEILPGVPGADDDFEWRWAPTAGAEWSHPLTRRLAGARLFVEPRAQIVLSPSGRNPAAIINEDSQSVEFDYAGLFDFNKATGFDSFEDGQRANVGVAASAVFDNGITLEASVGEQFRLQTTSAFDSASGVGEERSDIVGSFNLRYKSIVGVENRFRIDDDSGAIKRAESLAFLRFWRINSSLNYVRLNDENAAGNLDRREELTGNLRFKLTNHLTTGMTWRENLSAGRTIRQDYSIGYADDCASIELIYQRDFTRDVGLFPDSALLVRFTLRSLVD